MSSPTVRRLAALLTLVFLAACDDGTPTAIQPDDARVAATSNPGVPIGSFPLRVEDPAVKGSTGDQPLQGMGVAIAPGEWARIAIQGGSLTMKANPAYQPLCASGSTCFPEDGRVVSPRDDTYGIGLTVAYDQPQPSPGQSSRGQLLLAGSSGSAERILKNTSTRTMYVWVYRPGPPGANCREVTCYPPSTSMQDVWTSRYSFSGTQVLQATRIQVPLRVRASTPRTRPGEAVTFTAEADGQISDASGKPAAISWRFAENDTLPQPRGSGNVPVDACYNQRTCTYTPSRSGRMYVSTSIHGNGVNEPSEIIWRRDCQMYATPPTEGFLNNPVVLNTLEDLARRTRFTAPVLDRLEWGGYFVANGDAIEFHPYRYKDGGQTLCSINHEDDRVMHSTGGRALVAEIHTHPSAGGEKFDNTDGICPRLPRERDIELYDGPSGRGPRRAGDLDPWETANPYSHVGLVLDREHVHRWERTADDSGRSRIEEARVNLNRGASRCIP